MSRQYNFEKIQSQLLRLEDLKLKPYKDKYGFLTIGVGRNLDLKGISKEEAFFLLKNDIEEAVSLVEVNLPWTSNLSEDHFLVLVNMAFQMGIGGLLLFKNFLSHLQAREFDKAGDAMLDSKWAKEDSPKRALELFSIITGK
jgi:lysozyme